MNDTDGVYTFSNGDEYRGSCKTCSRHVIEQGEIGCFDGPGQLTIKHKGTF